MPYQSKEARAALLIERVLERTPETFTRPELAELMELKVSAYSTTIIEWCVRKGFIVRAAPKDVNGNLVRAYTAPEGQEGREKAEQAIKHLHRWVVAQKRLEEWNNGIGH